MIRDTRQTRKVIATFIIAGLGAIVAQRLLEPTVKKGLRVR